MVEKSDLPFCWSQCHKYFRHLQYWIPNTSPKSFWMQEMIQKTEIKKIVGRPSNIDAVRLRWTYFTATTKISKKNKPGRKQRNSVKNVTYPSAKSVLKCFIQRVKSSILILNHMKVADGDMHLSVVMSLVKMIIFF